MSGGNATSRKAYGPAQIRKFFEIMQRAGRLKIAEANLSKEGVDIYVDEEKVKHLLREVNDALEELQKTDPEFVKYVLGDQAGTPGVFKGSPDCPC